ncbi:hypothetical protein F5I97DRAFT_1811082, partial [Phlebopus sp. FC_14]
GCCTVINTSSFLHLFSEKQLYMAHTLAGLLSLEPGSLICGLHIGAREAGIIIDNKVDRLSTIFRHSPESWVATDLGRCSNKNLRYNQKCLHKSSPRPPGSRMSVLHCSP